MQFLYMPMEIASRELDSRLLITLFAASAGLEVIIGPKWILQKNARWMPKGFWIFKTLTPGDAKAMQRIKRLGHRIGSIDEEMPGLGDGSKRLQWVDKRSVAASEAIFCLGQNHASVMTNVYPKDTEKLVITGNPRWDFLRPELRNIYAQDAEAIKRKHGRIILINTNIGTVNSAKKSAAGHIRALYRDGRMDIRREEDRRFVNDLLEFEKSNFAAIPNLARRLEREFPDHTVVLRPHPTEKIEPYETELGGHARIKIIREGPAAIWLSAAEVLIHTSCTTATEAFALELPAICFETAPSSLHTYFLSGALSIIAKDEDSLIKSAHKILSGQVVTQDESRQRKIFEDYFAAQTGELASERIALHVAKTLQNQEKFNYDQWSSGLLFRRKWYPTKFQKKIFPPLSTEAIKLRLETLASRLNGMPLPEVSQIGDGQFRIYS
jgi:surface carbohydrate biosynthesis protein